MDTQKNIKPKLIFYYVFKDHIDRVWDCFKSPEIYVEALKQQANTMTITKGSDYSEVGTTVEFNWKNEIFNVFEVKEVINTKNYKMNKLYSTKLEPLDFKYTYINHFYWNTHDQTTLYKNELIFENFDALKIIDFKFNKQEKFNLCKYIESYLSQKLDDLFQYESILINVDLDTLWQVVTDWRLFQRHVPFIAEEINIQGNPTDVGAVINVRHNAKNNKYSLKVLKVENEIDKKEYDLELFDAQPVCPKQILKFSLLAINKNHTLLSFKHEFKEMIKHNLINSIAEEKKNILLELKKKLEKKN
jgi:ribosome-associated toxin RatA of RatAB toxin-antitoxin module